MTNHLSRSSRPAHALNSRGGVGVLLALALLSGGCASSNVSLPATPVAIIDGVEQPAPAIPMGDRATILRILDEGKNRNQVMDHLKHLTQEIGPRLTGSSNAEKANRWTLEQFESWGLSGSLFQWGEINARFDRGPSYAKALIESKKKKDDGTTESEWKTSRDFNVTTLAWSHGTSGPARGPVVRMPETDEEYAKVKDSLKGAWVILKPMDTSGRTGVRGPGGLVGERMKARKEARDKVAAGTDPATLPIEERVIFDGVLGFISTPKDAKDRIWTTAYPKWREKQIADFAPDVEAIIRLSDYDYLNSRMHDGETVQVEMDLQNTFVQGPIPVYDTIAEIRGTTWPDEVVIVCGHLDSWNGPGSQGATDNGTGSMVALEAARLLKAAGARPKRTIRFCLWTGEEQGLLGSKGYVQHLGESVKNISAVLNDDGGTNYQGGLKASADMVPMLAAATAPVNFQFIDSADGKPMSVNVQTLEKFPRMAASDHYSFVEVGVPGFFWDEVGRADYGFGWHTQHDRYELAIPEYLMQSSTCAAITAYNLANAPTLLPRVPMPENKDEPTIPPERFGVKR